MSAEAKQTLDTLANGIIAAFDIRQSKLPARYRRRRDANGQYNGGTRSLMDVYLEAKRNVAAARVQVQQTARELRIEMYRTRVAAGEELFATE